MNAAAHRFTAGAAIGLFLAHGEQREGRATIAPLAGGLASSLLTKLPDILEPATSPNHRQFFHSVAFAALLVAGFVRLSDWECKNPTEDFLKTAGKLLISAYLIHLAMDATTAKSLPLIGKL